MHISNLPYHRVGHVVVLKAVVNRSFKSSLEVRSLVTRGDTDMWHWEIMGGSIVYAVVLGVMDVYTILSSGGSRGGSLGSVEPPPPFVVLHACIAGLVRARAQSKTFWTAEHRFLSKS